MSSISLSALKSQTNINNTYYPMYTGFISPEKLKLVAEVPSFSKDKPNHQIAQDIFTPPVDQWQRPEEEKKLDKICSIYSSTEKDNLMANPILIGIAQPNITDDSKIIVEQKTIIAEGNTFPIDDFYNLIIHYQPFAKPLWILDGQHRVEGLQKSTQKNEPIPFVLLYDTQLYTPPFLAEIFTHVTTGATPMTPLHQEWMKYSFRLDKYQQETNSKSFETLIHLCKTVNFNNVNNPFHNRIQFNPYTPATGYYAFKFDIIEFETIISNNYYGKNGQKEPEDLAQEIAFLIRAAEELDNSKDNGSKLFSNNDSHTILAEGFLCGALSYLANNNVSLSKDGWKDFLISDGRKFDRCNWKLTFVQSKGALSSSNGVPSKTIAKECFDVFFSYPAELNGALITDYLQGAGATIKVSSYPSTSAGRISYRGGQSHVKSINPGGLHPFNMSEDTVNRNFIRIESDSPNCYITKIYNDNVKPAASLNEAGQNKGLNISKFNNEFIITVETMSYSGDTKKYTEIKLNK